MVGFLDVVVESMQIIPYDVIDWERRFNRKHIQAIAHMLLWICSPPGVHLNSSTMTIINKYYHYLNFKEEGNKSTTEREIKQVEKQKPGFHYRIKVPKNSATIIEVETDGEVVNRDLWHNRLNFD